MMFPVPRAGLILGALGRLMQQYREKTKSSSGMQGVRGAAFGSAINTQPQGPPTTAVSQAATTNPTGTSSPRPGAQEKTKRKKQTALGAAATGS